MDRDNDDFSDSQWVAQCAHRLRQQWPHVDPTSLDEAAIELWRREDLRSLPGEEAASEWLRPLHSSP